MKKFLVIALIFFVIGSIALNVYAFEFSKGPIELIIPFGAGGSHDMHARGMTSVASNYFERENPLIPVLKPGGSGAVGSIYVKNSKPDGHTLLFGHNGINIIAPHVRKLDYLLSDFKAVCQINYGTVVFVSNKDSGITSIEQLVSHLKEKPGSLTYASSGIWGALYIPWQLFVDQAGIEMKHLPTAGGGPALQAVLTGDGEIGGGFSTVVLDHIKAGNLIPLAVTSRERLETLPDVPTMIELGYDDVIYQMWRGVLVPKDTPDEIVEYLSDRFEKLTKDPSFIKFISKMGEKANFVGSKEFNKNIKEEEKMYKEKFAKYYIY